MTSIAIFGKPLSYESRLFRFSHGGAALMPKEEFPEPSFKPTDNETVLHYSVKGGQASLSLYTSAVSYNRDSRPGLVFGVALTADLDINFRQAFSLLKSNWEYFARELFREGIERRFEDMTLARVETTKWDSEDVSRVMGATGPAPCQAPSNTGTIIVYASDVEATIDAAASKIKTCGDIYITNNRSSCKDLMNGMVWKEAGKKIYTVENGEFVVMEGGAAGSGNAGNNGRKGQRELPPGTGGGGDGKGYDKPKGPERPPDPEPPKWLMPVLLGVGLAILIVVIVLLLKGRKPAPAPVDTNPPTVVPIVDESGNEETKIEVKFNTYENPIKKDLTNIISATDGIDPKEIELKVDLPDIVKVENNKLTVISIPSENTQVLVMAFYNSQELGRNLYTIAGKKGSANQASTGKSAPPADTYRNVRIHFKNGSSSKFYDILEHEEVSVKDDDGKLVRGTWSFEDGIVFSGKKTDNPWTMWATKPGIYTLTFTYKDGNETKQTAAIFKVK